MTQILIKKIIVKDGVNQKGAPWKRYSILTTNKNGQDIWLGCFAQKGNNSTIEGWQNGQTVELEIFQEDYNGKTNWSFKEPKERNVFQELDEIKAKLDKVVELLTQGTKTSTNANSSPTRPIAEEPRQEIPTVEQMAEMFGGEQVEKEPIQLTEIPF